jgi:hypothetical protein
MSPPISAGSTGHPPHPGRTCGLAKRGAQPGRPIKISISRAPQRVCRRIWRPRRGHEANLFFTFFGLDAIHKKRIEHIKVSTVGNPGMHMATLVGALPGMSAIAPT